MEILKAFGLLIVGGLILSLGADRFVHASSHIARRFGIRPVIIGLTVVAFGTSAPELAVNILAALQGNMDLAMGNVVGSNSFNVAFILGICAMLKPLKVSAQLIRIDIPLMVLVSVLLWIFAQDLSLTIFEASIFFAGLILYVVLQVLMAVKGKEADAEFAAEFSAKGTPWKDGLFLTGGLIALVIGAKLFVDGAIIGARLLGISEIVIGLTIVAAGTSLPEVATSVAATLKGERDIAIGNVVGSNIFNILGVLGLSGLVSFSNLPIQPQMASFDIPFMLGVAILCLPFSLWKRELSRPVGGLFFLLWLGYTIYLVTQS